MRKIVKYIIFFIFILIISSVLFMHFKNKGKKQNIFKDIDLRNNLELITNRETMVINETLFIGGNKKELENWYFDISIKNIKNGLKLEINKLTKEYMQNNIYDKSYLIQIFNYLNAKFEYKLNMESFVKNIEDIYINLRSTYVSSDDRKIEYIDNGISIKIYTLNYSIFVEVWGLDI